MPRRIKSAISYRFLLRVLPALFFTSLVFIIFLAQIELNRAKEVNRQLAQEKANNVALLLTEPVWQLSYSLSGKILEASIEEDNIFCARLKEDSEPDPTLTAGNCDIVLDEGDFFTSEIVYRGLSEPRHLGEITLLMSLHTEWSSLLRQLAAILILTSLLFIAIIVITILAFRSTIISPLEQVSLSLKHYQNTGKRAAVKWNTDDELGELIHEYNAGLISQQETESELREARESAEQALQNLQRAKDTLVQSEKMASLGSLVAGIAHEINTPLGNSLTVSSTLSDSTKHLRSDIESGALKKSTMMNYLDNVDEASQILERNLHSAAEQIRNFKQVAVDQTSEKRRPFELHNALNEILYALSPQTRRTPFNIHVDVPEGIRMNSFPGPLGQVVTNCVNNALLHGFEGKEAGSISISAQSVDDEHVRMTISDDGNGMTEEQINKAFDPFFTTKFGKGGSGLGLNLVYNLTASVLGGSVRLESKIGEGLSLIFDLPKQAPYSDQELESQK